MILFCAGGRDYGAPSKTRQESPAALADRIFRERSAMFRAINLIDEHGERFDPSAADPSACITMVVHGCAKGADSIGCEWAAAYNRGEHPFPPDWNEHGNSAGPIRNREMLAALIRYRERGKVVLCLVSPGGKGTADMRQLLVSNGFDVVGVDLDIGCECHPFEASWI